MVMVQNVLLISCLKFELIFYLCMCRLKNPELLPKSLSLWQVLLYYFLHAVCVAVYLCDHNRKVAKLLKGDFLLWKHGFILCTNREPLPVLSIFYSFFV